MAKLEACRDADGAERRERSQRYGAASERLVKIIATGSYVPRRAIPSTEIDDRLGKRHGWTARLFGIEKRHYADADETSSAMAAEAALQAFARAGIEPSDVDCIVAACGVGEQPIPSTAVLVQQKLGLGASGIPSFDVNSTCLSFVTALDNVADAIAVGRVRRALIVSADIASCGLDWSNPEAAAIFGDGAAAVIVEAANATDGSRVLASRMETYGDYRDTCRLEAGGTRINAVREAARFKDGTTFKMDGPEALACVVDHLPLFVEKLCASAGVASRALDVTVMHQASHHALGVVQKLLSLDPARLVMIFRQFGNQIATSIPHALDRAIARGQIRRGQKVMLLGTSAGISFGGLVFEY